MTENEKIVISVDATSAERKIDELQKKVDKLVDALSVGGGIGSGRLDGGPKGAQPRINKRHSEEAQARREKQEADREAKEKARIEKDTARAAARAQKEKERAESAERRARELADAKSKREADKAQKEKEKEEKELRGRIKQANSQMLKGGAIFGAGIGVTGIGAMGGSPAGFFGGMGMGLGGIGTAFRGAGNRMAAEGGNGFLSGLSKAAGGAMIVGGGVTALIGQLAQYRLDVANSIADTEKAGLFSGLSGRQNGGGFINLGMSPAEKAQQQSTAALAAGYRGSMSGAGLARALSHGVGAGAFGSLAGTVGISGGGSGAGLTTNVIAAGVRQGFEGSRLERWMSIATNAIEQSASMGVKLNTRNFGRMMYGMSAAAGGSGMDAANVLGNVSLMPGRAKQSLIKPFGDAMQALVLADAAGRSNGSFGGILKALEGMSPEDTMGVLSSHGEISQIGLSAFTQYDTAGKFLKAKPSSGGYGTGASVGAAARARAKGDFRLQGTMTSQGAADYITSMNNLQVAMNNLTATLGVDTLTKVVANGVADGLGEITKVVGGIGKALSETVNEIKGILKTATGGN